VAKAVDRCKRLVAGGLLLAVATGVSAGSTRSTAHPAHLAAHGSPVVRPAAAKPFAAPDEDASAAAGHGSHRRGSGPGYVYLDSHLIGETPKGLDVYVVSNSAHRAIIAKYVGGTVRSLRRLGLDVRWKGFGDPKLTEGVVTVRQGPAGCSGGPNVIGMTWPYWISLPNGDMYTDDARVALCPSLFSGFGKWGPKATIHHELGHAMGLGHMNDTYDGGYQVMNATIRKGVSTYQSGDVNGLRSFARNAQRVRDEIGPLGRFDGSSLTADKVVFTGWALLQYAKQAGVTIALTDNGNVVRREGTSVLRPDVNAQYDRGDRKHGFSISVPAKSGTHTYCVTAISTVDTVAKSQLGCTTWNG
jgi:hypothetical protein